MKKLIMVILISVPCVAATTGNIVITGTVPALTSITITPVSGYNTLDLSTTATNLNVASVNEKNNTTLGYTVSLTSANAGLLKNGSLGSVAYTAKYNGVSTALQTSPVTITSQSAQVAIVNTNKNLSISYTGVALDTMVQGAYSDTLTFTIVSN